MIDVECPQCGPDKGRLKAADPTDPHSVSCLECGSAGKVTITRPDVPRVLPFGWERGPDMYDAARFRGPRGLRVIVTEGLERDGKRWRHVSVSKRDQLPSWDDLKAVKDLLIGSEALAIQVLPRASEYVNIHPHCLHLWHCLDGDPVPDFRPDYKQL